MLEDLVILLKSNDDSDIQIDLLWEDLRPIFTKHNLSIQTITTFETARKLLNEINDFTRSHSERP